MDTEKVFNSLDHDFLCSVLRKFRFGKNFIKWIKILLKDQLLCVINCGTSTQYFKLEMGAYQGDPTSAYLFILTLEILFLLIKKHSEIKGIKIFEHCFLYTAYADDTFFSERFTIYGIPSWTIQYFFRFLRIKKSPTKCEIAGIGSLIGVQLAVCGMKCIDLRNEAIKILRTYFL